MQKLILAFFLSAGIALLSGCSGSYTSTVSQETQTSSLAPASLPGVFADAQTTEAAAGDDTSYLEALSADELSETEQLAQVYFTEEAPEFEGVDQIYPLDNDESLYHNAGLEGEYAPGNIIIYKVLTVKDRRDGNPFRFISLARRTKSDNWKIINCGY